MSAKKWVQKTFDYIFWEMLYQHLVPSTNMF